jgi:hypothetical protein
MCNARLRERIPDRARAGRAHPPIPRNVSGSRLRGSACCFAVPGPGLAGATPDPARGAAANLLHFAVEGNALREMGQGVGSRRKLNPARSRAPHRAAPATLHGTLGRKATPDIPVSLLSRSPRCPWRVERAQQAQARKRSAAPPATLAATEAASAMPCVRLVAPLAALLGGGRRELSAAGRRKSWKVVCLGRRYNVQTASAAKLLPPRSPSWWRGGKSLKLKLNLTSTIK